MSQQKQRQQRPPSCLPCRLKKLKCDKKIPCARCTKANSTQCVYPRQGTLGRPPKNTAFLGKSKNNGLNKLMIREFIFEHGRVDNNSNSNSDNGAEPIAAHKAAINSGFLVRTEWWILSKEAVKDYPFLHTYFRSIDKLYSERGLAIRKRFRFDSFRLPDKPRLKFNNLHLNYTWWTSMTVNLMIKRASRILLEVSTPLFLTLYILQLDDNSYNNSITVHHNDDYNYFERCAEDEEHLLTDLSASPNSSSNHPTADPLQSLPPDQAINLINDFFLVHPHSILINKSKLVKEYWSDTANPLLLSVIYGTTQCLSKNLQGIPVMLWESNTPANRNPFLAHAHFLLESLPTIPSASDYQATVILALFELLWGYSKLGMSLLATTYVMGTNLGLWDKSFKPDDPLDAELVNMTFWAVFRSTTYGSIELGASLVDSLVYHEQLLPPMNMHESLSYQHNLAHGNVNGTGNHSYMIESFYSGAVVTLFTGIFYACLPKAYFTLYGLKTDDSTFKGSDLLTILRSIDNIETRLHTVLDNFYTFIQHHRRKWTTIQLYTIETTYRLYRIHSQFLQPILARGLRKHQEDPLSARPGLDPTASSPLNDLNPANPDTALRLQHARNDILALVDDLETLLLTHNNRPAYTLLPHDIMIAAFETATQLLMLSYPSDPSNQLYDAMKKLLTIHLTPSPALKNVQHQLKTFLKRHEQDNPSIPGVFFSHPSQQQDPFDYTGQNNPSSVFSGTILTDPWALDNATFTTAQWDELVEWNTLLDYNTDNSLSSYQKQDPQ
ncbi:hypothetical protein [Absidia glauca]|uniref:Zn(2)-C6 fungal-type domain-containing protein n=1 Tax=Absidia glauca TaxID=4829 RepID=A0A168NFZ7_ABSGL|nr:hypothetical protein [Absidia glauca]